MLRLRMSEDSNSTGNHDKIVSVCKAWSRLPGTSPNLEFKLRFSDDSCEGGGFYHWADFLQGRNCAALTRGEAFRTPRHRPASTALPSFPSSLFLSHRELKRLFPVNSGDISCASCSTCISNAEL